LNVLRGVPLSDSLVSHLAAQNLSTKTRNLLLSYCENLESYLTCSWFGTWFWRRVRWTELK